MSIIIAFFNRVQDAFQNRRNDMLLHETSGCPSVGVNFNFSCINNEFWYKVLQPV